MSKFVYALASIGLGFGLAYLTAPRGNESPGAGFVVAMIMFWGGIIWLAVIALSGKKKARMNALGESYTVIGGEPAIAIEKDGDGVQFIGKWQNPVAMKKRDIASWNHIYTQANSNTKVHGTLVINTNNIDTPIIKVKLPLSQDEDAFVRKFEILIQN